MGASVNASTASDCCHRRKTSSLDSSLSLSTNDLGSLQIRHRGILVIWINLLKETDIIGEGKVIESIAVLILYVE